MKFDKIYIEETVAKEKGLKEIRLNERSLGNVVAFVGKNGAGKSRILDFIANYFKYISGENFLKNYIINIPDKRPQYKNQIEQAHIFYREFLKHRSENDISQAKDKFNFAMHHINNILPYYRTGLFSDFIKIVNNDDIKRIKQSLSNNLSFHEVLNNIKTPAEDNGESSINEFTELNSAPLFAYIKSHTDKLIVDEVNLFLRNKHREEYHKNPQIIYENLSKTESFKLITIFKKYIHQFLGKEFLYESNGGANLGSVLLFDGINFDFNNLSPGQRTLFAYAILFFYMELNGKSNISECIVIIDEPELHLHPQAQVELLDALRKLITKGQVFIATHSMHILSHLNYDEIYMVRDGEIKTPSRMTPGDSMIELMGIEGHINQLEQFITSTSSWAFANFMAQCFKNPDVIFSQNLNDPQYKLFKKYIQSLGNIQLLDFGAGKGRVGYTIDDDMQLCGKITYNALEPNEAYHDVIRRIGCLESLYSDMSNIKNKQFDIVLLCNVLHEIHPKYWIKVLNGIKQLLKEDGRLIVIEDNHLPKGESAHEFGYLLLNSSQIEALLASERNLLIVQTEEDSYKQRFTFCVIRKDDIQPSSLSLSNALNQLKEETYESLKEIRQNQIDVASGRLYANLAQLYINAELALEKYDIRRNATL